jgi:hypothetical protein
MLLTSGIPPAENGRNCIRTERAKSACLQHFLAALEEFGVDNSELL